MKYGCRTGQFDSVTVTVIGFDGRKDPCQQADISSTYLVSRLEVYVALVNTCPSTAARTTACEWSFSDVFCALTALLIFVNGLSGVSDQLFYCHYVK